MEWQWIREVLSSLSLGFQGTMEGEGSVKNLVLDSRKVGPGDLFVAIKGERNDGHLYIKEAVEKGAGGIIGERPWDGWEKNGRIFWVPSSKEALRTLGKEWLKKIRPAMVLAVGGSVGKTTTKDFLAAFMGKSAQKTQGSQNGELGIPLTLCNLKKDLSAAIIEIGIDGPGQMKNHLDLVRPDGGVVTSLAPEHLEGLGSLQGVIEEETKLLEYLRDHKGFFSISRDEPLLAPWLQEERAYSYGFLPHKEELWGEWRGEGRPATLNFHGESWTFSPPMPGKHNFQNLLAAAALALGAGQTFSHLASGLAHFEPPAMRSVVKKMPRGETLLWDVYNANPSSMGAAITWSQDYAKTHGKEWWVCLGDMKELGNESSLYHKNLVQNLEQAQGIFLLGPAMKDVAHVLAEKKISCQWFETLSSLGESLKSSLHPEVALLIKGSRSLAMENLEPYLSGSK